MNPQPDLFTSYDPVSAGFQNDLVLKYLMEGKELTTKDEDWLGVMSLPRRIKDLRDHRKIDVQTRKKAVTNRFGRKVKISVYFLTPEDIKKLRG